MRTLIIVVLAVLAIIFVGGALNIGGAPIFCHLDSMLHIDFFMDLHDSVFSFLYSGVDCVASGLSRTKSFLERFQEKPGGIDKKGHQQEIDEAAR